MSLAPASIRGFFLNARFAVNGIQCAARSFGTLTAAGRGLLSSMGGLFGVSDELAAQLSVSSRGRDAGGCDISAQLGAFEGTLQNRSADPEYFAVGILGIEPQQRQLRVGSFQLFAAAADFAQQPALRRQVLFWLIDD